MKHPLSTFIWLTERTQCREMGWMCVLTRYVDRYCMLNSINQLINREF